MQNEVSTDPSLDACSVCLWVLSGSPMTDPAHHWNILHVEIWGFGSSDILEIYGCKYVEEGTKTDN